jgi:hypothetical protein
MAMPRSLRPEPVGKGLAAGGDEDAFGFEAMFAVVLAERVGDLGLALRGLHALHGGAHDELQALLLEDALEALLHLGVHARGDLVEVFHHRHLGAEAGVDRAHLEPDDARADHHHRLGNLGQFERAGGGDDHLLVHRDTREGGGFGAGGDDDVLRIVHRVADLDLPRLGDRGPALDPVDLVLLEQELDALRVRRDHVGLVGQHLAPVDLRRAAHQPIFSKFSWTS